ncbi:sugar ABC transporter ATP-binding protein [Tabrizicola sp.]|uniref:sugar ABC transporter ATP-binding protein n=1 Tax=Tabrizicola sp. TaxID=2005166 RepID=UPI00286BC89D|nr:sugar ABC transporter ATP-binding protein [Tabrizicola sp.]
MPPVLDMRDICKSFGGTMALSGFSLQLEAGRIHALVGENGAGKSTLIKTMTGIHQPDSGQIFVDGQPAVFSGTAAAQRAGIAAIYQEPMVFPDLSVAENIFISHQNRPTLINWSTLNDEAAAMIARLGVTLDPRQPASELTLAEQQTVEIARAISLNVRALIMDEPSASLSDHEVKRLFGIARSLRDQGVAVLYISHRLDEIFALADTVTVMRDGKHISTHPVAGVTQASMISEMVGRDMQGRFAREPTTATGETLLAVTGLQKSGVFRDISFTVAKGEIVCFSGLVGARRTDVGLALFGVSPADAGRIEIAGQPVTITNPNQAQALGIAYVSEDRRKLGLALTESIASNITLPMLAKYSGAFGWIDKLRELADAQAFRERLNIKAANMGVSVGTLSGGNQQKVMLAKWLNTKPRLLIVDEPTRGIDVGAKAEVHQILRTLAAEGVAIVIISSDLPEVLSLADRVIVMREGRIVGEFPGNEATDESVMALAVAAEVA